MSTLPPLLLADLAETLKVVMPIIFMVIYGVAHLVGALQQEKKKREQRPRREREDDQPVLLEPVEPNRAGGLRGEPERAKPVTLEETLRREVEEFLKRAQGAPPAKSQPKKQPAGQQRPRSAPQQQKQQPVEPPPPRRLSEGPGSVTSRRSEAAQQGPGTALPTGAAVDAYVAEQMRGVAAIGQHAQRLGEEVAQIDDRMQAQLQQKFDHQVGTLAPVTTASAKASAAATAAKEIRDLLKRPGGMRQIVIANEILRRPEERW